MAESPRTTQRRFLFSQSSTNTVRSDSSLPYPSGNGNGNGNGHTSTLPRRTPLKHNHHHHHPRGDADTATETEPDLPLPPHPRVPVTSQSTYSSSLPSIPPRSAARGRGGPRVDSGASYPSDFDAGIEEEDEEEEFDAGGATTQGEMDPPTSSKAYVPPVPPLPVGVSGAIIKQVGQGIQGGSRPTTAHSKHAPRMSTSSKKTVTSHHGAAPPATTATTTTPPSSQTPLTSLYLVAGLPKSPHTWTLAEPDSVDGCRHAEGAVARWWRAEVLGSTVSPGVAGQGGPGQVGRGKRRGRAAEDVQRMLAKALKLSFPKEVEIIASTLQPASTVHTFTFNLRPIPGSSAVVAQQPYPGRPNTFMSMSAASSLPSLVGRGGGINHSTTSFHSFTNGPTGGAGKKAGAGEEEGGTTYYGTVLTVYSHADASRAEAIRKALATPSPSTPSASSAGGGRRGFSRRAAGKRAPWGGQSTPEATETEAEGETEGEASGWGQEKAVGGSTLFLPRETVFWLPYALTLVSKHPIYDLMRDFLTLSWARFSKDVQSHSLQIAKILEHPSPRSGDIVKLDAGAEGESVEVVCRFPGGLDFGRGLVDVNFTMWPLFRALNLDNILTICEIALAPTGRVLFLSRYPAMLGIAVHTIKYILELRGWSGLAHPAVHARDAKIYLEDPGPWLIGLHTDCRFVARMSREVAVCDLDINSVHCATPPPGAVSTKQQRDRFRKTLMAAFEGYFHPDYSVPSEFKEAFPAGRFRPLCSIKTRRGAPSAVYAEVIPPPEWWFQPRVLQAFDAVLKDKYKKPSLLKRLTMLGMSKRQAELTTAEQLIQRAIRRRATAFVDARDELETKIGRLSRRLNFLINESDLWREKFVAFEGYAEKLALEAGDLRAKIGKEQRESRRLSGLITVTAQEKQQLQSKLSHVEEEHQDALVQLDQMRLNMEAMEREREQMVAEVEEQIERALASMSFSESVSEGTASRSNSRTSSRASTPGSQRRMPRSFSTGTTLRDSLGDEDLIETEIGQGGGDLEVGKRKLEKIEEREIDEDEQPEQRAHAEERERSDSPPAIRKKRFSAGREHGLEDGMGTMDAGISEKSERISEKVNQIQMKLEMALADLESKRRVATPRSGGEETGGETDGTARRRRRARSRGAKTPVSPYRKERLLPDDVPDVPRRDSADTELARPAREEERLSPVSVRTAVPAREVVPDEDSQVTYRAEPVAAEETVREAEAELITEPEPTAKPAAEPEPVTELEATTAPEPSHAEADDEDDMLSRRESTSTLLPGQITPQARAEEEVPVHLPTATFPSIVNGSKAPPVSSSAATAAALSDSSSPNMNGGFSSPGRSPSSKRLSRMTTTSTTDGGESDTDFQSAYSSSPIDKRMLDEDDEDDDAAHVPGSWGEIDDEELEPVPAGRFGPRQRVSSNATEVGTPATRVVRGNGTAIH